MVFGVCSFPPHHAMQPVSICLPSACRYSPLVGRQRMAALGHRIQKEGMPEFVLLQV